MSEADRPQSQPPARPFSWQSTLWQQLLRLRADQRLPHALLLTGPAGCGKARFAEALAQLMLCQRDETYPCGECKSCLLMSQGTHPDLVMVTPVERGKAIRVDQIRGLSDFIGSAAQQGGYRVVVITPADEMNVNAANALLKGLEEPGRDTLFILQSDRPGRVMPTIRSRCQQYTLGLPPFDAALDWLQQQPDCGDSAERLLRLSGGAPLRALSMARHGELARREERFQLLEQLLRRQVSAPVIAARWAKEDALEGLDWLASVTSDLIRLRIGALAPTMIRNQDALGLLEKLANLTANEKLFEFKDKIQDYRVHLMRRNNPNQQLLWEDLLIGWRALFSGQRQRPE
ncbi:DNA polymerase III subunit delta' [Motiliproteus sediminis]|uniref:DNA polymerase III subunit delta' n=1 Tax=Motiliproteus sediminis TaxID=1468178 RepID=UPI001AEFC07F|nr:DNA polymerase III subunit delta' [Motiliproteus sediminis]